MKFKSVAVLFFLLAAPILGISQNPTNMKDFVINRSFQIKAVSVDSLGHETDNFGMGMILNGKYLATCYHVVHHKNDKLRSVSVMVNSHTVIYADLNFQRTNDQYDFSKHIFNSEDRGTDFIILKLKHPITPIKYKISVKPLVPYEKLYCNGISSINREVYFESSYFLCRFVSPINIHATIDCSVGDTTPGFSGTPVFNSKREVVGIIFGMPANQDGQLNQLANWGTINPSNLKVVKLSFSKGHRLQYFMDIHYLMDQYLKGYL